VLNVKHFAQAAAGKYVWASPRSLCSGSGCSCSFFWRNTEGGKEEEGFGERENRGRWFPLPKRALIDPQLRAAA
jgi:hypothetical protein